MTELYGSSTCPFTAELRADLEWQGEQFVEFDVDADAAARARMLALVPGEPMVPVLVRDGKLAEVGYRGRGCYIKRA
jgi:mycoredoxin